MPSTDRSHRHLDQCSALACTHPSSHSLPWNTLVTQLTVIRSGSLRIAAFVGFLVSGLPTVSAQIGGQIAEKPIAVGYARGVGPKEAMTYIGDLMKQMELGSEITQSIEEESQQERLQDIAPKVADPLYGAAWYMVTGLVPSFQTVSFQQVVDEADARRLVEGRRKQFADQATLEDSGNGCFKVLYKYSYEFAMPPGQDESSYASSSLDQGSWKTEYSFSEKDGKKMVNQTTTSTFWFRYHDSMLYEGAFEELFTMTLPSAGDITSGIDGSTDLGFDAYLDRIPQGIRTLGWNMLSSAVGSQLQQRDDEPEIAYNARRSSGDLLLGVVQSVLFDVDHSEGWLRYADADDQSLRGELRIRARQNSALSKRLLETAGTSRFAPILSDNAAVTAHVCSNLPEEAPAALTAVSDWMKDAIRKEEPGKPEMIAAVDAIADSLAGIAEHRTLELLFKIGWTKESGGAFYGGLHLHDNPDLLASLSRLLMSAPDVFGGASSEVASLVDVDGRQMIRIAFTPDVVEMFRSESGMSISHIWLAHENSCLWYAAGSENAKEIIRQSIERCNEAGRAARTPLVSLKIDMERWLSYPQDDPAGIAQLPWYLDENAWWFPPSPIIGYGASNMYGHGKPTPIMSRVFELGGSQQFWLTLETDESGILLKTSLGLALANHMIVRLFDSQERMIQESRRASEQAMKEQQEALEKSQSEVVPPPLPPE